MLLRKKKSAIYLPVPAGFNGLGVRYAMCCIASNLAARDIDVDEIRVVDLRWRNLES